MGTVNSGICRVYVAGLSQVQIDFRLCGAFLL